MKKKKRTVETAIQSQLLNVRDESKMDVWWWRTYGDAGRTEIPEESLIEEKEVGLYGAGEHKKKQQLFDENGGSSNGYLQLF